MFSSTVLHSPAQTAGTMRVLVVDDEVAICTTLTDVLGNLGFAVLTAGNTAAAHAALQTHMVDIVLLDLELPGGSGLPMIEEIRTLYPGTVVVVMTGYATVSSAVEAMRSGATEYLVKPFSVDELSDVLEWASERRHFDAELRRTHEDPRTMDGFGQMIGRSPEMERVYRILSKVAHTMHPVLILGEMGTGKELAARTIHYTGPNAVHPFIPVDCGSLIPNQVEREMFGYVRGAFTGANRSRKGLMAAAEGSTVLLNEVDELSLDMQAKLSLALQEKAIRPLGSNQRRPMRARILAATHRDLAAMVEQGKFRKDLYLRLNVVNVKLPSLRERRQDVFLLAAHFLKRQQRETGIPYTLDDDVLRILGEYNWPDNVRELENTIERACALSSGPVLHVSDMPTQIHEYRRQAKQLDEASAAPEAGILTIAEIEKQAILNTLRQLNSMKPTAARLLGISKTTLYRKLKKMPCRGTEL